MSTTSWRLIERIGIPGGVIVFLIGITLVTLGQVGFKLAKRIRQLSADELLARDKRPPVLYLRSFKFDDVSSRDLQPTVYYPLRPVSLYSEEETLAKVVKRIGPCIAIGKPDVESFISGFARKYVDDNQWKSEVERLMSKAGLVVICVGDTDGLLWEIKKAAEIVPRERVLLLITSATSKEWWDEARSYFKCNIPFYYTNSRWCFQRIIYFDKEGQPCSDDLIPPFSRTLPYDGGNLKETLIESLEPVFRQLQIQPYTKIERWIFRPLFWLYIFVGILIIAAIMGAAGLL
jgi:hypothetical protein